MRIVVDKDLQVPMRDGVLLSTDVYRPDVTEPAPTLVMRLPYNKEMPQLTNFAFDVMRGVKAGYAVVIQDTRGRYASGGTFKPYLDESSDGADTISWATSQPWSGGAAGMIGGSYFGATQWAAASTAPPTLRAIAPVLTSDQFYDNWTYQGGAFQLGFKLLWSMQSLSLGHIIRGIGRGEATAADLSALIESIDSVSSLYRRTPLLDASPLKDLAPYYFDWLQHPGYDEFWKATAVKERYEAITVPALNIGGWYDLFLGGTIANYVGMRQRGGSPAARNRQRLLIGPWSHGIRSGFFPERAFGFMAGSDAIDLTGMQLRWFDWLIQDRDTGMEKEKPVRVFLMGADKWREADDWPLPETNYRAYYLHCSRRANSAAGDGQLSTEAPAEEPPDVFLYDPRDPVPTNGGAVYLPALQIGLNAGPRDQRLVEERRDVLCYTTPPLAQPLEVIGPVQLVLYVSSSAPDTDFTGKLVDVFPDGRAINLTDGILRVRYRESLTEPSLMRPGEVYRIRVDLVATANLFGAGHRIRLEVSSSNFPRFDRNTNTGGSIAEEKEADMTPAVNRVHHSRSYPSQLILPVIPGT